MSLFRIVIMSEKSMIVLEDNSSSQTDSEAVVHSAKVIRQLLSIPHISPDFFLFGTPATRNILLYSQIFWAESFFVKIP